MHNCDALAGIERHAGDDRRVPSGMLSSTWRAAALFAVSVAAATACDHDHPGADLEDETALDETSDGITGALDHAAGCDAHHVTDTDDGSDDEPADEEAALTGPRGEVSLGRPFPADLVLDSALQLAGQLRMFAPGGAVDEPLVARAPGTILRRD